MNSSSSGKLALSKGATKLSRDEFEQLILSKGIQNETMGRYSVTIVNNAGRGENKVHDRDLHASYGIKEDDEIKSQKNSGLNIDKPERKKKPQIQVKNYIQLSNLFVTDKYGPVRVNFSEEIKKRVEMKRALHSTEGGYALESSPTFNTEVLNSRMAVQLSPSDKIKHMFPGIRPSKSENMLKLNRSAPDTRQFFDPELQNVPILNKKPRDKAWARDAKSRKSILSHNIFQRKQGK
jgi:hypothetical protein